MNESPQFTKALLSKSEAGKEQRKRLAAIICEELEIANVAMGSLPDRWKALEAMYRNELAKSARKATNKPDEVRLHFPLVQPKIDVLCGRVLDPIFGNDPFLVAKSRGPDQDPATVIQRDVHTLLEIAGFERVARTVTPIVGVTGQAYVRVTSDLQASGRGTLDWQASVTSLGPIAYAGLKLEGIHPAAMRIYPAEVDNLWAAKTLAHLAPPMRVREIREMQEIGRYFNDFQDWRGGDDYGAMEIGRSQSQDLTSTVQAQAQDDQIVATMAGLRKMSIDGEPERWWEFEVAVTDEELLAFREYQLPQPWYVQLSFFQEVGSVIRSNSVANNLQHLQLALNEFGSTLANGSYMAAFPPIFSEGTFMGQHVPQYRAGEVQRQEFGGGINQVDIRFNGGYIPQLMIEIDRRADLVARISTNASGGQFRGNPTATEVAAIRTRTGCGFGRIRVAVGFGRVPDRTAGLAALPAQLRPIQGRVRLGPAVRGRDRFGKTGAMGTEWQVGSAYECDSASATADADQHGERPGVRLRQIRARQGLLGGVVARERADHPDSKGSGAGEQETCRAYGRLRRNRWRIRTDRII